MVKNIQIINNMNRPAPGMSSLFNGQKYMNPGRTWFFGLDEYCDKVNKLLIYHDSEYKSNGIEYFEQIELSITNDNQIKMQCDDKFVILPIEAIEPWALDLQDQCNKHLINFGGKIIDLIDEIVMEEWPDVDN